MDYHLFYLPQIVNQSEIRKMLIENPDVLAFFDTKNIICSEQVITAIYRAKRAFELQNAVAHHFNIELMLQLSGLHKINRAIELYDMSSTTSQLVILHRRDVKPIEGAIQGLPSFKPDSEAYANLRVKEDENACKEIISQGVRLVLDHE